MKVQKNKTSNINILKINKDDGLIHEDTPKSDYDLLKDIVYGKIITELLDCPTTTDIMLWNNEVTIVDSNKGEYKLELSKYDKEDIDYLTNSLYSWPNQLATRMHTSFSEGKAILDAELTYKDVGILRFNAIHESLINNDYPAICIRATRFSLSLKKDTFTLTDYANEWILTLLESVIRSNLNVIIGGNTGSGKTSLLRYLATNYISSEKSIITIEDTYEAFLKMLKPSLNVLALKSNRLYNFSDLIKTSLRQNPDWILVSESRGEEVLQMLEAVGTGHNIITTIHATSSLAIPSRIVDMSNATGYIVEKITKQVHQNIDIGVYIDYYNDKKGSHRKITEICEYYLDDNDKPQSHMLYSYDWNNNKYVANKIKSQKILRNLQRTKININKMKGIFL